MLDPKNFNTDWQFLRDFFGVRYLRLLVTWFALVPIVLVFFRTLPDVIRLPLWSDREITIALSLPFKWWLLWFSSLLYICAWTIYLLAGPRFIRRYKHYGAYQDWQHSQRWIIWEWNDFLKNRASSDAVDILVSKSLAEHLDPAPDLSGYTIERRDGENLVVFKPIKEEHESWFYFQREGSTYRLGLGPDSPNGSTRHSELFWELYGAEASSRPTIRMAVWIILAIAALLFAIVILQNICAVIRYLVS